MYRQSAERDKCAVQATWSGVHVLTFHFMNDSTYVNSSNYNNVNNDASADIEGHYAILPSVRLSVLAYICLSRFTIGQNGAF